MKAIVAGNEPREKYDFNHKNLIIHPWLPHSKIMNLYSNLQYQLFHLDGKSLSAEPQWNQLLVDVQQ